MPDHTKLTVRCPCCSAEFQVDRNSGASQSSGKTLDLAEEAARLRETEARRDQTFARSLDAFRSLEAEREKKFDELLKKAKESPDEPRPPRPFDLD